MNKVATGLFAIAAVAVLVVTLGAGRSADGQNDGQGVAVEKAVRTAGVDMAVGSFTCRGQSANGEVTAGIDWSGTSGVVTASTGLGITITTVVDPPAEAAPACVNLTDGLSALAESLMCTVSRVRVVGVTSDFVTVCSGITDDTNAAVASLTRYIAENVRVD